MLRCRCVRRLKYFFALQSRFRNIEVVKDFFIRKREFVQLGVKRKFYKPDFDFRIVGERTAIGPKGLRKLHSPKCPLS